MERKYVMMPQSCESMLASSPPPLRFKAPSSILPLSISPYMDNFYKLRVPKKLMHTEGG